MSALDGKITIENGLRPCIVRIPALAETVRNMSGKRTVKEIRPAEEYKGLFHLWAFRSELVGKSPCYGGHPAGQISATFAIVEYSDGTIHEVEPTQIRFVDNAMSEYEFPEIEK